MDKPKKESATPADQQLAEASSKMALALKTFESGVEPDISATEEAAPEEEAAQSATSEPASDVKEAVTAEEVDESGVPYKNRFFETTRKLERLEEEFRAFKDQSTKSAPLESTTAVLDAMRAAAQPAPQTAAQTPADWDEPASKQEAVRLASLVVAKERNDAKALQMYPELQDPNSLLAKEVIRRAQAKVRMGYNPNDPMFALETASSVFGELMAEGKIRQEKAKAAEDEKTRRASVEASLPSIPSKAQSKTKPKLSSVDELVLTQFRDLAKVKMTDDEFLKLKKKRGV